MSEEGKVNGQTNWASAVFGNKTAGGKTAGNKATGGSGTKAPSGTGTGEHSGSGGNLTGNNASGENGGSQITGGSPFGTDLFGGGIEGNHFPSPAITGANPDAENGNRSGKPPDSGSGSGRTGRSQGGSNGGTGETDGNNSGNKPDEKEEDGAGNVLRLNIEDPPKKGSRNKTPTTAKPSRKKRTAYSDDKQLLESLVIGIKTGGEVVDKIFEWGVGLAPGIWSFSDEEAGVIARIMLKRADAGNKKVIDAIASIVDKVDYIEAALIILPRAAVTIKEVAQNGVNPKFLPVKSGKNTGKQADKPDGTQNPTE